MVYRPDWFKLARDGHLPSIFFERASLFSNYFWGQLPRRFCMTNFRGQHIAQCQFLHNLALIRHFNFILNLITALPFCPPIKLLPVFVFHLPLQPQPKLFQHFIYSQLNFQQWAQTHFSSENVALYHKRQQHLDSIHYILASIFHLLHCWLSFTLFDLKVQLEK